MPSSTSKENMKIVLTWKVDRQVQGQCPDFKPDPYTGEYPSTHCLVLHLKNITEEKSAEFETEDEVQNFISNAPPSCYDFNY